MRLLGTRRSVPLVPLVPGVLAGGAVMACLLLPWTGELGGDSLDGVDVVTSAPLATAAGAVLVGATAVAATARRSLRTCTSASLASAAALVVLARAIGDQVVRSWGQQRGPDGQWRFFESEESYSPGPGLAVTALVALLPPMMVAVHRARGRRGSRRTGSRGGDQAGGVSRAGGASQTSSVEPSPRER